MSELNAFNTHKDLLIYYLKKTDGDIIEFGTGYGSTAIIREFLKNSNRKILSFENNKEWYDEIKNIYPENDNHKYFFSESWEKDIPYLADNFSLYLNNISICFIDSSPWESRTLAMNLFKNKSQYIMIHDVDYFNNNNIFGTLKINNTGIPDYFYDDISNNWFLYYPEDPWPSPTGPPTLVFSNTGYPIYKIHTIDISNLNLSINL